MDRSRVRITITIKEMVGIHSITIAFGVLQLNLCPEKNHSHANFCSTEGDSSLYQQTYVFIWSRFHWQWQQCATPELQSQ